MKIRGVFKDLDRNKICGGFNIAHDKRDFLKIIMLSAAGSFERKIT